MLEDFDLKRIQDIEGVQQAIVRLLNLVEELAAEKRKLREEVQQLRDENNRLKGEPGKPTIKANTQSAASAQKDYSSERERRKPQARKKASQLAKIKIDRTEVRRVDPSQLPPDAEFKGYEETTVQDVKFGTDTVLFLREKFHSA
jgi:regulator of replication initiation timing